MLNKSLLSRLLLTSLMVVTATTAFARAAELSDFEGAWVLSSALTGREAPPCAQYLNIHLIGETLYFDRFSEQDRTIHQTYLELGTHKRRDSFSAKTVAQFDEDSLRCEFFRKRIILPGYRRTQTQVWTKLEKDGRPLLQFDTYDRKGELENHCIYQGT